MARKFVKIDVSSWIYFSTKSSEEIKKKLFQIIFTPPRRVSATATENSFTYHNVSNARPAEHSLLVLSLHGITDATTLSSLLTQRPHIHALSVAFHCI